MSTSPFALIVDWTPRGSFGQLAVAHRRVVSRALWIPARVPAAATQVR